MNSQTIYVGASRELQAFKNDLDTDSPNPVIIFLSVNRNYYRGDFLLHLEAATDFTMHTFT